MKVALDANPIFYACDTGSDKHAAMQHILRAWDEKRIKVFVSRQTLHELEKKADDKLELARKAEVLPCYAIGSWDDCFVSWDDVAGTWNDAAENDRLGQQINQGSGRTGKRAPRVRDNGAFLDAVRAGVDVFVTSDKALRDGASALGIAGLPRVLTPEQLAAELGSNGFGNSAEVGDANHPGEHA